MQAKLTISEPGDQYEQEADRVAETVMRMPEPIASGGVAVSGWVKDVHTQPEGSADAEKLHRQTMDEEMLEEEEETLQAKEVSGETPEVTPELEARLNSSRGSGQPLPESVRAFFEPRFGYDFGEVRVHTDGQAMDSARSVKAHAYTLGQDIVFGSGQYAPETPSGKQLLAHELTHVVQQSGADGVRVGQSNEKRGLSPITQLPDHGTADDLVKRDKDKGSGHQKLKETQKKAPKCQIAKAQIRPVFFRNDPGKNDPSPTGKSLAPRLQEANRIWGKCGVEFTAAEPRMVEDSESKIAGNKREELTVVERAYSKKGTGPQVFFLDNDLSFFGGGVTGPKDQTGDDAKIMLSDHGSNDRLLAHELGHAMGIGFHPDAAPYLPNNSIMQPSGVNKTNPDLVTDIMCSILTWPAKTDKKCWHVDPDDKATFDKPEQAEKKK